MDAESGRGPIYNLKVRYRSHKLKVVLYVLLQTISVVVVYLLVIYRDEYNNIGKLSVGKMDYDITFVDDTYLKMDGWVEVNSPLSTTFYLKEVYVHIFIDTESDIKEGAQPKKGYKDRYAPPITIHVPFLEPLTIQPGRVGKKTATRVNVHGNIIPSVLPTLITKIEENIGGKLRRFRFCIYPTLELRISFLTFIINTSLEMTYNFVGAGIEKEIKEVKFSENVFTDKMKKLFQSVQLSTHIHLALNPFRISGITFKYFFICFENTHHFCFKGELKELDLFPIKKNTESLLKSVSSYSNFNTIIEFTTLGDSMSNGVDYIHSIYSLKKYRETYPLTKVKMLGKWGNGYWSTIDSRTTFIAYRHVNLNFTIGNAGS